MKLRNCAWGLLSTAVVALWVTAAIAGGLKEGSVPTTLVPEPGTNVQVTPPLPLHPPAQNCRWVTVTVHSEPAQTFINSGFAAPLCCCGTIVIAGGVTVISGSTTTQQKQVCD